MSFETDLTRIEAIIAELERDDVPLDRALALFEEGVERLRTANEALGRVEGQLQLLVERATGEFDLDRPRG
jgi:exodeoxyribonuclease VII small subunit